MKTSTDFVFIAQEHLQVAKTMFESMGYGNIEPMIHLRKEGAPDIIGTLSGVPQGRIYEGVQYALQQIPYVPEMIVLISDSYYIFNPDKEYIESLKKGTNHSLEVMFKLGDLRVKEACNISLLCKEAMITIVQSYKWTPVDGWEWGQQEIMDSRNSDAQADWEFERLVSGLSRRSLDALEG